jgi:hypothetical protein
VTSAAPTSTPPSASTIPTIIIGNITISPSING